MTFGSHSFSEQKLGGIDVFLPYIRDYVATFQGKSITTWDWKAHLYAYFEKHGGRNKLDALNSVDWDVSSRFSFFRPPRWLADPCSGMVPRRRPEAS